MIATLLTIVATWMVLGSAATYVWLTVALRAAERAETAELEAEHRQLLAQST